MAQDLLRAAYNRESILWGFSKDSLAVSYKGEVRVEQFGINELKNNAASRKRCIPFALLGNGIEGIASLRSSESL